MASDKGVLARAIAGGFKGGTEAMRQTDELAEKFMWGDEVARQARDENIRRFEQEMGGKRELAKTKAGYAQEQAKLQSRLGVSAAEETRGQVKQEAIDVVKDRLSEVITDPKQLFIAKNMADKNFSFAEIVDTPAKKLTPAQEKSYYEIAQMMIDAGAEGSLNEVANSLISDYNRRVPGRANIRGAEQSTIPQSKDTKKVSTVSSTLAKEIKSDKVSGIHSLRQLSKSTPKLYKRVLADLITKGLINKGDVDIIGEQSVDAAQDSVLPPRIMGGETRPAHAAPFAETVKYLKGEFRMPEEAPLRKLFK